MIRELLDGNGAHAVSFGVYVIVALIGIFSIRRFRSTWMYVSGEEGAREARRISTLRQAGFGFLQFRSLQLLIAGLAASWILRMFLADWTIWDAVVVAGTVAVWPFQEWLFHAYLLHLKPLRLFGRTWEPIYVTTHRTHHLLPWEPGSGVVPIYFVTLYLLGLPILWRAAVPLPQAISGVATTLSLIVTYEWIHYLIHTAYKPKGSWYASLWRNHRLHHFKNEHRWYGVTSVVADVVFGTRPAQESIENSETCWTLGSPDERAHSMGATPERSADEATG